MHEEQLISIQVYRRTTATERKRWSLIAGEGLLQMSGQVTNGRLVGSEHLPTSGKIKEASKCALCMRVRDNHAHKSTSTKSSHIQLIFSCISKAAENDPDKVREQREEPLPTHHAIRRQMFLPHYDINSCTFPWNFIVIRDQEAWTLSTPTAAPTYLEWILRSNTGTGPAQYVLCEPTWPIKGSVHNHERVTGFEVRRE